MTMLCLRDGREFNQAEPAEVEDFLRSRTLTHLEMPPEKLRIANDGKALVLQVSNGAPREYPLRKSFFLKLLKWFSFPVSQIRRLDIDTVSSVLNDFLLNINSGDVTLTIENDEALTITSRSFSRLPDLDVLRLCRMLGVEHISRNDFFMRLYSHVQSRKEIVKGDECGFGYNVLNSETGFSSISIYHYILRYICTNGAVVRFDSHDERVHYGYKDGELTEWLGEQIMGAGEECGALLASLQGTRSVKAGPQKERIARTLRSIVGRAGGEAIMGGITDGSSLFDMFNLVTHAAKQFDVGRRLKMEKIAGDLLKTSDALEQKKMDNVPIDVIGREPPISIPP